MVPMNNSFGYFVEHVGDCWQSVFPDAEAEHSELHDTAHDALNYMVTERGVPREKIAVLQRLRRRFWPSH
jgi:hypothetical protein